MRIPGTDQLARTGYNDRIRAAQFHHRIFHSLFRRRNMKALPFDAEGLEKLKGNIGVGHVRYSTAGASNAQNVQPLVLNYVKGTLIPSSYPLFSFLDYCVRPILFATSL